jgi:hypothetical protein
MILPGRFKIPKWQKEIIDNMIEISKSGKKLILYPCSPEKKCQTNIF